jgi:hypothetical protein
MSPAKPVLRVTYRATSGRHYFTRQAALKESAKEAVRNKYPCGCWMERDTGATCRNCEHLQRRGYWNLVNRLVRLYNRRPADTREASNG